MRNQTGSWDTPGRTRTLDLSDGGSVVETITRSEPPQHFEYELTEFQKIFGALVSSALAEWTFESVGAGVKSAKFQQYLRESGTLDGTMTRAAYEGMLAEQARGDTAILKQLKLVQ